MELKDGIEAVRETFMDKVVVPAICGSDTSFQQTVCSAAVKSGLAGYLKSSLADSFPVSPVCTEGTEGHAPVHDTMLGGFPHPHLKSEIALPQRNR